MGIKYCIVTFVDRLGMVTTYQLSKMMNFGTTFKVVPVNTKNGTNAVKCFKVDGTERFPILAQPVLPDLNGYKVYNIIMFKNYKLLDKIWIGTYLGINLNKITLRFLL